MLRASVEYAGSEVDLSSISEGAKVGDAGIEHGERLTAFAEAAVLGEAAALDAARDALRAAAGPAAVVDAAGVIGNFQRMVRIADGTGIPLDAVVEVLSGDFREALGLEDFESRRSSKRGRLGRAFGSVARRAIQAGLRLAGRRARREAP